MPSVCLSAFPYRYIATIPWNIWPRAFLPRCRQNAIILGYNHMYFVEMKGSSLEFSIRPQTYTVAAGKFNVSYKSFYFKIAPSNKILPEGDYRFRIARCIKVNQPLCPISFGKLYHTLNIKLYSVALPADDSMISEVN